MLVQDKSSGECQHPSMAGFLAFCESKPPEEEYNWLDNTNCACGQYAQSAGIFASWRDTRNWESPGWGVLNILASGVLGDTTFGAVAERVREAMPSAMLTERWIAARDRAAALPVPESARRR